MAFFALAPLINSLVVLMVVSAIVLVLVSAGIAWLISKRLIPRFRSHFTVIYSGVMLGIAFLLVVKLLPWPEVSFLGPALLPGTAY